MAHEGNVMKSWLLFLAGVAVGSLVATLGFIALIIWDEHDLAGER